MDRVASSSVKVKKMQRKDARDAAAFCAKMTIWMWKKYLRESYPKEAAQFDASGKTEAKLAGNMKDPDFFGFIALHGDEVCGILLGRMFGKSGLAKIAWIAIDPAHQHEGIGIRLMTAAEEHLIDKKCHKIFLNTLPALIPAIRLYMKCGLLPEAFLRKHWWGTDFIVMSKCIGEYVKH